MKSSLGKKAHLFHFFPGRIFGVLRLQLGGFLRMVSSFGQNIDA
jgi:hypothetical protein